MSSIITNNAIQIVNEDQQFNQNVLKYVKSITADDIGFDYHIISVFGSQSTGKSTLLNSLFGTKFDVMDESKRQQTTKGIWLAYASQIASKKSNIVNSKNQELTQGPVNNHKNIIIMDVEGTDGRERGEDQDFERKAALFALSTSEVLIINIWEHQVGLYQGANMGLLKTVFEVNLSLFGKNPKKCLLLFVIRDHVGTTSLESLSQVLTEDIQRIWSSLSKPKNLEEVKLENYFDLSFTSLPHKILKPDEFVEEVGELGDKLNDTNDYFKEQYHKQVPFDGWTIYSEKVWDQIVQNKELDLPTQQILVSRFRCDEITTNSMEIFNKEFKLIFPNFDGKSLEIKENIGEIFNNLKKPALENYDNLASRYTKSVYNDRRKILIDKIGVQLNEIYKLHLINLKKKTIELFNEKVIELKQQKKLNFKEVMGLAKASSLKFFTTNLIQEEDSGFKSDLEEEELEKNLNELIDTQRSKEIKTITTKFSKRINTQLKEKLVFILNSPNEKTWDEALLNFNNILDKELDIYKLTNDEYDFKLGLSIKQNNHLLYHFKKIAWRIFYNIIHDYLTEDNVVKILRDQFEDKFRYDEEGIPIVWNNPKEIDWQYKQAREAAIKLLPIFAMAKTSENIAILPNLPTIDEQDVEDSDDDDDDLHEFSHILSDMQQESIKNKVKKQIDVLYVDAKRSTMQAITTIPYWIYMIIVVLGWNEFMAIIRNPLYFTLLAILLVSAYFIHKMNLWGPVQLVVSNTANETLKVAKAKLKEILVEEDPRHGAATEAPVESIPLVDLKQE